MEKKNTMFKDKKKIRGYPRDKKIWCFWSLTQKNLVTLYFRHADRGLKKIMFGGNFFLFLSIMWGWHFNESNICSG